MESLEGKTAAGVDGKSEAEEQVIGLQAGEEREAAESGNNTAKEGVKPKAAGTRTTKLVRVKQEYIDCLLQEPTPKVFDGVPEEIINNMPVDLREQLRTAQAETRAYMQKLVDKDLDILNQYRTKGYAMEEIEIGDEDEDVQAENQGSIA